MGSQTIFQRGETADGRAPRAREDYQACLQYYGLSADPFDAQSSQGLFYPGAERKQAVDSLQHFSRYATTPIFLTGRAGVGKTTVLNEFARLREPDIELVIVAAELMMTPERMLLAIAASFGISVDDGGDVELRGIYDALIDRWAALAQSERHAIVAIDNVQDLSAEVLEALFEVFLAANGNVKLVLVGESQGARLLDAAAEKVSTLINRIELAPFSQQDVGEYLHYRMRAQGFEGELPLSPMQVQALTYRSRGNLAHMHQIASGMLQAVKRGGRPSVRRFPLTHLLLLLLLLGLIFYLWQSGAVMPTKPFQQPIVLQGSLDRDVEGAESESTAARKTQAEVQAALDQAAAATVTADVGAESVGRSGSIDGGESGDAGESIDTGESSNAGESADSGESNENRDQPVTEQLAVIDSAQSAAAVLAASSSAEPGAEPARTPESAVPSQQAGSEPQVGEALPESVAEPAQPAAAVATQAPETASSAHRRLLAWSDVGYALQIFGTHNPRRAKELVDEYFGQADLLFYETRHNGQPW